MPTYQYRCKDCNTDLEVVQKFTDDALTECPSCDGTLRKVFNAVGVVFKGSGFYRNDSRSADTSGSSAKESTSEKTGSKSESGTGSKSENNSVSKSENGTSSKSENGTGSKGASKEPAKAGASTGSSGTA